MISDEILEQIQIDLNRSQLAESVTIPIEKWVKVLKSLEAERKARLRLREQLEHCKNAMTYAHEDRCDEYYAEVKDDIFKVIAESDAIVGEKE